MNILYMAAESANWVISLCNEICKKGHKVTCVVQDSDEYDKENKVTLHKNLTRVNVSMEHFFNPNMMKTALTKQLMTEEFDVVFGSHAPVSTSAYEIAKMKSIPWGVMLLDIPKDLMENDRNRMLQWLYWFDVLKFANQIVFNTHIARDVYHEYTRQYFDDTNVIVYGTDLPKELYNAGKDIKGDYVVSACRLTNIKNVSSITRALGMMNTPIKQVIIGRDRGDLQYIKAIAEEHGVEIEHKDLVSEKEKYELIKNSAMVIYPQESEYIGGLNPWEGMYLGKPVICKDYKVLKDLYGERSGVQYVPPNDTRALANKILEIYYTKDESRLYNPDFMASVAKKKATFSTMADSLCRVFDKMVRK